MFTHNEMFAHNVMFHTHSVIDTRMSVIFERKVWLQHASVWFIHVECDFHTQSVISTRRVLFPHAVWFWHAQMSLRHLQLWFLHAECDVDTHECDYDTHDCDYDTHTCQNHTLCVEIILVYDVHMHSVMDTRTSVISERKMWLKHGRVWFIYVECDFHTQGAISTHRV
jgi:hypothetical protein